MKMVENDDDVDFDSMLDGLAQDLDTKIVTPHPISNPSISVAQSVETMDEVPKPLTSAPQMHVQDSTDNATEPAVAATTTSEKIKGVAADDANDGEEVK